MRELSEQVLLSRPVFIREVGLPTRVPVDSPFANRCFRIEKTSPASEPLRFQARSVWPWPAVDCTLPLPLDPPIMTTLVNPAVTLVTNYTSATYVVTASPRRNTDASSSCHTKLVGKI